MTKENSKIKLLHILPNLSPAGAERVVFNLLSNLDSKKYELALLLFKDSGQGKSWQESLKNKGVLIKSLKKRYLFDFHNFKELYKFIKKFRPDIVHTHLGGDIYGRLAAQLLKVKLIVSTEHNLNIKERYLAKLLKQISAKFADKIFAVSEAVKEDAINRYKLNREKISVVYNGIDLNYFKTTKQSKGREGKTAIIGTLSRLSPQKGLEILIEASKHLKSSNYLIKIAGEGELKQDLQNLINKYKLENKITLVGQVEPRDFLEEIDLFVFPSLWEGLGLSLLEAGAMAKPVIASQVDGIKEIIDDNSGFLFPAGDYQALAKSVDLVLANLDSGTVQGKVLNLTNKIKEQFSLASMIEVYDKFYQDNLKST